MKTEAIVGKVAWLGLILLMISPVSAMPKKASPQAREESRPPFRYVIVSNEIGARRSSRQKRYVEILLEERAFSVKHLQELFTLVSVRFKLPRRLDVHVYTSLQDIPTPEEREAPAMSERQDRDSFEVQAQAFFYRDGLGNEWFSYNNKKGSTELETVVLKGKAPAR